MHKVMKFSLIAILSAGVFGCSGPTPEEAAAEARVTAADARDSVADANARVTAADARVRVADALVDAANADARVAAATTRAAADTTGRTTNPGAVIPSGTPLKISLIDALDSGTSSAGDRFLASLSESIVVNGVTVLPAGTTLRGRVVDVKGAGRVQGLATMNLALTDIVRGDQSTSITTNIIFAVSSESTRTRDAEIVAGGAGVGAAIGAIAGGAKGAAVGAATGGGAGTGAVLAMRGDEIRYGPETRLTFTLMNSVSM